MYNVDGDFGKVRLCRHISEEPTLRSINRLHGAGWHECNEKYKVERDTGCTDYLLILTVSGKGVLHLGNETFEILPSVFGVIPPGVKHTYYAPDAEIWQFYWIHLTGNEADAMMEELLHKHGNLIPVEQPAVFYELFERLLLRHGTGIRFFIEASRMISELIHHLFYEASAPLKQNENRIVSSVLQYIEDHYAENINIGDISRHFYVSTPHLIRIFKLQTGFTPYEYIKRYRIGKSAELLQYTTRSVGDIAQECGFNHTSNFIAQFKGVKNMTPAQFRKNAWPLLL